LHMAEVDAAEALSRPQGVGVRMAAVIKPAAFLKARGLDEKSIAFPPADRVAIPRGLSEIRRELPSIGMNLPEFVELLEEEHRNAGHLQNLERNTRNGHRVGHTVRHAVRLRTVPAERLHTMFVEFGCRGQ